VPASSFGGMDTTVITGLDGQQTAQVLVSNHAALVEAEATELQLAAHWAMLHNPDTLAGGSGSGRVLPGTERVKRYGGVGTPRVTEFAAAELGALIGRGPVAAGNLMANAVDLQFRHPLLWSLIEQRLVAGWKAAEVARRTRAADLSLEQARWVDAEVADYITTLHWGTFLGLLEAKIIEVDPDAAEARRRAKELEQFVATGRCNEFGLKTVVARAQAGDAVFFVAMVNRIAAILQLEGDPNPIGVRRASALGILANPARALVLLQKYATSGSSAGNAAGADTDPSGAADGRDDADGDAGDTADARPDQRPDEQTGGPDDEGVLDLFGDRHPDHREPEMDPDAGCGESWGDEPPPMDLEDDSDSAGADREPAAGGDGCPSGGDLHPRHGDADAPGPVRHRCPVCAGAGSVPGDPSGFVKPPNLDPKKLLPAATLYVHMSLAAFRTRTGVARAEDGIGPITVQQAAEFLAHTNVSIKPVIDLTDQRAVDCYETPSWMREAVHLLRPRSVYPYSGNLSRRKDLDHPIPYVPPDDGGPPGQTDPYRMGPLGRHEHRVKTHARGWRHLNPLPGVYLWRTPHGYWYRVDPHGTHALGKDPDLAAHGVHGTEPNTDPITRLKHADAPSPLEHRFTETLGVA
jgi:hypothetical protein